MSDLPKITDVIEVQEISPAEYNRVSPWGSEPKEDNGWISVADALPEQDQNVFYYFDVVGVHIGQFTSTEDGDTFFGKGGFLTDDVTYWQPIHIPLPPMLKEQAS